MATSQVEHRHPWHRQVSLTSLHRFSTADPLQAVVPQMACVRCSQFEYRWTALGYHLLVAGVSMLNRTSMVCVGNEAYPKALIAHIQKAINSEEVSPKPKHVRAIILETHYGKSSQFMYSIFRHLQVLTNSVACWKYLVVMHKILRSGYKEAVDYDPKKIAVFEEIKRTHAPVHNCYGQLIFNFCNVIIKKFAFHRKYHIIPGDFEISQQEIMTSIGGTPESLSAFCMVLLDYLEVLLNFQPLVFATVDHCIPVPIAPINCRLSPLTQCVQDCAALYDLTLKALITLHTLIPPELLGASRERFNEIYLNLRSFFNRADSYDYIRDYLKIPQLPNSYPNLFNSGCGIQTITVLETPETEKTSNQLVEFDHSEKSVSEKNDWKTEDFDVISKRDEHILAIEMLKTEVQRIQVEKSDMQEQLFDRIMTLEEEIKALVQVKSRQDEQLTMLIDEVRTQTAVAAASQEKYEKVRAAYMKLREEHVDVLKEMETTSKSGLDARQQTTDLESERITWREAQLVLEAQLADARNALQVAENRSVDLAEQIKSSRKADNQELHDLLLKSACMRAKEDANTISAVIEDAEFGQCRSCTDIAIGFAKSATAEVLHLKEFISKATDTDATTLPLDLAHLSSCLNSAIIHAKAISNTASDIVKSDELAALSTRCLTESLEIFSLLGCSDPEATRDSAVLDHVESLLTALARMQILAESLRPRFEDVNEEDLASVLEQELQHTAELIARAETKFKELLERSEASMTGVQLEVHSKILDPCTELMSAISILVSKAHQLQTEIVNEGRGSATTKEFYKRHNRWTEGLFSAAKSVGVGANLLVKSADSIVTNNDGHLERLTVAALEISSSTTQLLVASRVKADKGSQCLRSLETAAQEVSRITGQIVAGVQNASAIKEESQDMDFAKLSYTQAHKTEVDAHVRVLELEAQLVAQRRRLAEIRRFNYSNTAEFEQKS